LATLFLRVEKVILLYYYVYRVGW